MVRTRTVIPQRAEREDTIRLTTGQKAVGLGLLLFYLAMIAVTIATLPYADSLTSQNSLQ